MTLFVVLAALFAAVALAFVLPPLLRGAKPAAGVIRDEMNSLIYREQLAELRAAVYARLAASCSTVSRSSTRSSQPRERAKTWRC